jgi:hypothetical protein
MPTLKRGQEVGRGDGLSIYMKTQGGSMKNVAEIFYNIYDFTTGVEVLLPPTDRTPVNAAVGEYYASFFVPRDANLGKYRLRWFFRQKVGSTQVEVESDFDVVADATQIVTLAGVTPVETDLIRALRIMLRDNNPDRNYHFSPPTGEESINQFTRVFGFLWEDYELLEFLRVSLDSINSKPPMTFYRTLDELISRNRPWRTVLLEGAMIHAIFAIALNWVVDEFDYSIGGVSLSIEKSSKYQSMASDLEARFTTDVTDAKETVKIFMGLKQSKFGVGIRSSFGPSVGRGALTPRRFLGV